MKNKRLILTIITLVAGIAFVAIGAYFDEISIVLSKAINICLECIGIG